MNTPYAITKNRVYINTKLIETRTIIEMLSGIDMSFGNYRHLISKLLEIEDNYIVVNEYVRAELIAEAYPEAFIKE